MKPVSLAQRLTRLATSLAAIAAVSVIFAAKATDAQRQFAAESAPAPRVATLP